MFGVRLKGPEYVFCYNQRGNNNMIILESVLHKKHNVINYYSVHEAVAADIKGVSNEYGDTNLAGLLTKVVDSHKRWDLCYHIFR